jgi:hypothetical protein
LDIASGVVTYLRHRHIRTGCLATAPAIRVVRGGLGRRRYSLSSASAVHCLAHR